MKLLAVTSLYSYRHWGEEGRIWRMRNQLEDDDKAITYSIYWALSKLINRR